ncbi:OsmC family protein [Actinoplanes sp. NPDC020271]|uniref:OsmC family protein n=1 Tax=Actinoplanes sp. NPDC020271 TaxID=3363896 RepID=UPI003790C10E
MTAVLSHHARVEARPGLSYEILVRGHRCTVDQPVASGGVDAGPTPTELFVAALASCVAFYAGQWLTRHGYPRTGLAVDADFDMGERPTRVTEIRLRVHVPAEVPKEQWLGLHAVASHCTVSNTLMRPPVVTVTED